MSCHGCASPFGFLKKEIGCPNCGFSYCKKCLRFKVLSPKEKKEVLVCSKCHAVMTSNMDFDDGPPAITKALQKLESLDNPAKPPITVYKQSPREVRLAQLKRGLSEEDKKIADRLESLMKHDHADGKTHGGRKTSEPIQEEIEARLARLKDEDPELLQAAKTASSNVQLKSKPETDQDLIAKYSDEVKLDNKYQAGFTGAVSDLEGRLTKLRGESNPAGAGSTSTSIGVLKEHEGDEELPEHEQIARIIAMFKAEVELESQNPSTSTADPHSASADVHMSSSESENEDVENLCRICDEKKATLKCEECDGDLFCKKCFQELHTELGEIHKPTHLKRS